MVKKVGLVLILIFALSIIVRLIYLDRPLGEGREWSTAHCLRILEVWHDNGAAKYNFNLISTYNNDADRNISNNGRISDKEGNYYFNSVPPFSFILPHFVFQLLNIYPDALSIQIFNIIFHLISSFFIYLIIKILIGNQKVTEFNIPAILGFTIYTFAPVVMWFQSNYYFSDIFIQPFFIIAIYLLLKLLESKKNKTLLYILLGLTNFICIYTEGLGLFFAASLALYSLFKIKDRVMRTIFFVTVISTIGSVVLIVWQQSLIAGFDHLIQTYLFAFARRSGVHVNTAEKGWHFFSIIAWLKVIAHYMNGFLPFFVLIIVLAIPVFKTANYKKIFSHNALFVLGAGFFPVMFNHLVLFQHTAAHNFSVLKAAPFIAIFVALLYHFLTQTQNPESDDKKLKIFLTTTKITTYAMSIVAIIVTVVGGILWSKRGSLTPSFMSIIGAFIIMSILFLVITLFIRNYIKNNSIKQRLNSILFLIIGACVFTSIYIYWQANQGNIVSYKTIGSYIAKTAKKDEVVFIRTQKSKIEFAQVVYYAHRNIQKWQDENQAQELIKKNKLSKGIIYILNNDCSDVLKTEKIELIK